MIVSPTRVEMATSTSTCRFCGRVMKDFEQEKPKNGANVADSEADSQPHPQVDARWPGTAVGSSDGNHDDREGSRGVQAEVGRSDEDRPASAREVSAAQLRALLRMPKLPQCE